MSPKKKILIISIVVFLFLAAASVLIAWMWSFANRPLNTSLTNLAKQTASQPTAQANLTVQTTQAVENLTPLPTPEEFIAVSPVPVLPTPTQAPGGKKTMCGGPPLMFLQVAGIDENNLADAIRIVRIDFTKPEVSVLAIQRATWVSIPDLADHGITAMLVNSAHSYGVYFLGKSMGVYLLHKTILQNFGINSDHYLDVNFESFTKAVDTVGGVDVNLLDGYYDSETKYYFSPGWHHLDGKTALLFVRMRYSDSDWQRINRQTDLVMSVFKKLVSPAMLPRLPGLAYQLKDDFTTDLSPVEISQLVCLASSISIDDIKFYEIGQDMVIPTTLKDKAKSQIMLPKWDIIRPYVEQFVNGTLP